MKSLLTIAEIQPYHTEFVGEVIKNRWNVSKERAKRFVNEYLTKRNDSNCYVAEYNHIPVGMGTFHVNNDIGIDLHPWFIGLWVHPMNRGNGIGYEISLARFDWARMLGYKTVYLDTISAEGYHEKFGWENTGLIGFYGDTPTVVMKYDL